MRLFRRVFRLVWGGEVDPALRPVLAVSFAGSIAGSAGWTFVGIWAIRELGASRSALGIAFLVGAALGAASGYLGGHLSDKFGRRPLILVGSGGGAVYWLGFILVDGNVQLGLAWVAAAGVLFSLGGSASQAMIADLVAPELHEAAYASQRVAANLGVTLGAADRQPLPLRRRLERSSSSASRPSRSSASCLHTGTCPRAERMRPKDRRSEARSR